MWSDSDDEDDKNQLLSTEFSEENSKIHSYFLEFNLSQDDTNEQESKNSLSNSNDREDIKRSENTSDSENNNNESDIYYDFDSECELEDLQNVGWGTDEETREIMSPSQEIFEMSDNKDF